MEWGRQAGVGARRRRPRAIALLAALLASLLVAPSTTLAAPDDVTVAEDRLAEVRAGLSAAQERLAELEREFELAVERYLEVREERAELELHVAAIEHEIDLVRARMDEGESTAANIARRLYQRGAAYELEALFRSGSLAEAEDRMGLLRVTARSQLAVVERLSIDRDELERHAAALDGAHGELAAMEAQLADLADEIERTLEGQRDEIAQLRVAIEQAEHELAEAMRLEAERLERERLERERLERERLEAERRERERLERERLEAERREQERLQREREERERAERERQQQASSSNPAPAPPPGPAGTVSAAQGQAAVDAALSQVGKPYRYAASGPNDYDCSGLTMWAWRQAGVRLPHSSRMQFGVTTRVSRADIQPGDLLFFGSPIHHVGMYVGDGQMVEAPYTGEFVRVRPAFNRSDLTGIGRPRS